MSTMIASGMGALLGSCGPFSDVSDPAFCPFVLEIFYLGITTGTSPTTYSPAEDVTRLQMAALLSRTVDSALKRGSRRAALGQFWTPQSADAIARTSIGPPNFPWFPASDGTDIWVSSLGVNNAVSRIRASDGRLLEVWTGVAQAYGVLAAMGSVFVTGETSPGRLYQIDPRNPPGAATTVASNLGPNPTALAFDGARIWTASSDSVSLVTPGTTLPWTATTVTAAISGPGGMVFDGSSVWIADGPAGALRRFDSNGAILQSVTVGSGPHFPVFDGANIWIPSFSSPPSVSVVRASTGTLLATLTGNGLNAPLQAAFDGQRVLVTNDAISAQSVSLWKAADLTPLGSVPVPGYATFACSDGLNFWITLGGSNILGRF